MNKNTKILTLLVLAVFSVSLLSLSIGIAAKGGKGKPGGKPGGEPAQALVTITSPLSGAEFEEGTEFTVTAQIDCINAHCKGVTVEIDLPTGLSLPDNDPVHDLGNIKKGKSKTTSWTVSADTPGNYDITVSSYIKGVFSNSDTVDVIVTEAPEVPGYTSVRIIQPYWMQNFEVNENFQTKVNVTCSQGPCYDMSAIVYHDDVYIELVNNDPVHYIGDMDADTWVVETWEMLALAPTINGTAIGAARFSGPDPPPPHNPRIVVITIGQ